MLPVFFVHIPKTAGTSFRKSAESFYGREKIVYDYSPSSEETSNIINKWIYEKKDPLNFFEEFSCLNYSLLSGHVNASKYIHLLGAQQTVSFFRDPVQRVVSEYYHFVRNNNYKGDLPSFYRKPQFINRQTKIMHGVPFESVGFFGLTEEYEISLEMLNSLYGLSIKSIKLNMGRKDQTVDYKLSDEERIEIEALNEDDIVFYQKVKNNFRERYSLFRNGETYVHGLVQQLSPKKISGWAWYAMNSSVVSLNILVDDKHVSTIECKELRPGLLRLSPPRNGYVGFQYNFSEPLLSGSIVKVVVVETGQLLTNQEI
ncbi:sulfotransferase family 2 domain-containing protein [Halomonas sp. QX-2]|uniref:Sulfotransferase family 2 domain-containing protein n=1 Tax=Vreelandella sedimenti TaxID=2729618 RepID=A0A7Z0SR97_9GAMM|nr:sulfotransferase family 2 domain-containing protein [Halomonas sedimenti]NYT74349.1 sulfotransferase family 2 domain-containing protein [Halomonas sedimenti]